MRPRRVKYDEQEKEGLSEEYKSFSYLWSAIETKVMSLIEDLQEPVLSEMTDCFTECQRIEKLHQKIDKRMNHIEAVVLAKDGELDIFDK